MVLVVTMVAAVVVVAVYYDITVYRSDGRPR